MKLTTHIINRSFTAGLALIVALFLGFFGYVYVSYSDALIGDVRTDLAPDPLKGLQTKKFQAAISRLEIRTGLPDAPKDLPNPFDAPKR